MTVRADTTITFSVDMATNLANGTFNPPEAGLGGTDAVYARGTFNGWGSYLQLVQVGTGTVYTNTVDDTVDANGGNLSYIYHDTQTGDEGPADWANRTVYLPTNSGASVVLPTVYFYDQGPATSANVKFQVDMSEEIQLGHFNPANGDTVVIAGSFNGWSPTAGPQWVLAHDASIMVTNYNFTPPLVLANVYTNTCAITLDARTGNATVNCAENYKYVEMPEYNWESPAYPNADSGGNRFFTEGDQTLPLFSFNDLPYSLAYVTLNVDMTGPIEFDPNYEPNSVTIWGPFNGWSGPVAMTNNPGAANPNIFTTAQIITMPEGTPNLVQVRYTNTLVGGWVYDYIDDSVYNNNNRRTFTFPVTAAPLHTNVPTFYFLDLAPDDYLAQDTTVTFSVDMTGAVDTNGVPFDSGSDGLYINGMFANGGGTYYPQAWYPWSGGPNPVSAPAGYQMTRVGSSSIYSDTITIPAGTPVALAYQYGIDRGGVNGGPIENEAASGANHFRVVRSTVTGAYVMPTDVFTNNPFREPVFAPGNLYQGAGTLAGGQLSVGTEAGGKIPVSWLGRPGAHLQVNSALSAGGWQDVAATDGTHWTAGYSSPNGLVSVTNWPAGGNNTFFRLVKP
jgi:hypothetical protein